MHCLRKVQRIIGLEELQPKGIAPYRSHSENQCMDLSAQ